MNQDINGTKQNNIITAQGATAMVDNVMTSSGENIDTLRVCKSDKRGHCTEHGVLIKKLKLSSQKWGLLSEGRGYG